MKRLTRGGLNVGQFFLLSFCVSLLAFFGCGAPPGNGGVPYIPLTPEEKNLAGTWERHDSNETLVIGEGGWVLTNSQAMQAGSDYRYIIPVDGSRHRLSAPFDTEFNRLEVVIGAHRILIADDGVITMERHLYQQFWVGDEWPNMELYISGKGRMTSPTTMEIEMLKDPVGLRQVWIYSRTGR